MPQFLPKRISRVIGRTFPFVHGIQQTKSNIIGTFNTKLSSSITHPNNLVFWKVVAKGNIQNSSCFKRQEQRSYYIAFPPPSISVNKRRDFRVIIKRLWGGDNFVRCWSRDPFVLPNKNPLAITYTPTRASFDNFQPIVNAPPGERRAGSKLGVENIPMGIISCSINLGQQRVWI